MNRSTALLLSAPAIGVPIPLVNFNALSPFVQIGWTAVIVILFVAGVYSWIREGAIGR